MADFKTHITVSTVLGVGYGAVGHLYLGAPPETCVLAGILCSVSGMLPDLDSDSGVPLRESVTFAAAVVPMMLIHRFHRLGLSPEAMVLAGASLYLIVRFGFAKLLKRFTVHRGMFHSLPAAAIAGLVIFLLGSGNDFTFRLFKACAVVAGFMSHLVLDEIWSVQLKLGKPLLKKSFGTAVKFWSKSPMANVVTYAQVALLTAMAIGDPIVMNQLDEYRARNGLDVPTAALPANAQQANQPANTLPLAPQPQHAPPGMLQPGVIQPIQPNPAGQTYSSQYPPDYSRQPSNGQPLPISSRPRFEDR